MRGLIFGLIALTVLTFATLPTVQARVPGSVIALENCPGDSQPRQGDNEIRVGIFGPILTALLPGLINQGLKLASDKLKEASSEAQVDVLQFGDHFFNVSAEATLFSLRHRCMLVLSQGTTKTKRTLDELLGAYPQSAGRADLASKIKLAGFSDEQKPALVAVLALEFSDTRTEARFVPKFVVVDHSIRERRSDSRERDMTLEIEQTAASAASPFAETIIKFDGLVAGKGRALCGLATSEKLNEPGQWFALPAVNETLKSLLAAINVDTNTIDTEKKNVLYTEIRANAIAAAAGEPPFNDPCTQIKEETRKRRAEEAAKLAIASSQQQLLKMDFFTTTLAFFDSCKKQKDASDARAKKLIQLHQPLTPNGKTGVVAYNMKLAIKEFRDRPVAKFFGELLADDTTRTALTDALVDQLDPAKRATAAQAAANQLDTQREAYEQAWIAAEKKAIEYASAGPDEKALALLDLRAAQRAANRAAAKLGMDLPYPEAGTWL